MIEAKDADPLSSIKNFAIASFILMKCSFFELVCHHKRNWG